MKLDTRWLEWSPPGETGERVSPAEPKHPPETIFVIFDGDTPGQMQTFSVLEAEPAAYEEVLNRWLEEQCVFRDRTWGGVKALHKHYAVWCDQVARDVPASLAMFEKLLREAGCLLTGNGLVYGLLLREDWESQQLWLMC